jgi:hypothetical protein
VVRTLDASCQGKARFATFAAAEQQARLSGRRKHRALQPYACPFCGGYHIGGGRKSAGRPRAEL